MNEIRRRRKYDNEFKEQAVALLLQGDKTTQQLAEELGIHWGMLSRWKREHLDRLDANNPEKPASKLEEENRQLRKELASTRAQRDILKKALSIFSQAGNGECNS
jgi:transposase